MSIDSNSGIKMNWAFALTVSVVVHVVGLGMFMLCSDSPDRGSDASSGDEPNPSVVGERGTSGGTERTPDPVSNSAARTEGDSAEGTKSLASTPETLNRRDPGRVPPASASNGPSDPVSRAAVATGTSSTPSMSALNPSSAVKTIVYEVKPGDNLTKIASRHKCTVTEIAKLNNIKPNKVLWVGFKLKVPAQVE